MTSRAKVFLVFTFLITCANTAHILVVIPMPSYSHQIAFREIWKELSRKNHNVTLLTTDPIRDPSLVGLTEIDLHDSYNLLDSFYEAAPKISPIEIIRTVDKIRRQCLDFSLSQFSEKVKPKGIKFDLVIAEALYVEVAAIADLYECPKMIVGSFELPLMFHSYLGNPSNFIANTDIILPFVAGHKTFFDRLVSVFHYPINFVYKFGYYYPKVYEIIKKYLGNNAKHPMEVLSEVDLVLVNTHPILNDIRAYGPNTVQIGGGIFINPEKPLPIDLQEYLDSATEGYIYFSLGTNSKSMFMGEEKIKIIMEALGELPFKVLWKFEVEDVLTPPKNIKLIKWAPQQDILRHPNIKLFITQGGLQSLEESIINKVPMAMMPMYGDQEANAKRMQYRGLAKIIPHKPLPDKEEFKKIVMEVITDPSYKEKVTKAAELLLDQPMPAVDKAVWWIEYVIRHKGAKHLRNPVVDIPFYQYYCLDIIGAIFAFFYAVIKLVKLTIWGLKRIFIKSEKSKKE